MLLEMSVLLDRNLSGDAYVPTDDVLEALTAVALDGETVDAWSQALGALLSVQDGPEEIAELLGGLQFLISVGGVPGARLLAAFWELDEFDTLAEPLAAHPELGALQDLLADRETRSLELAELAVGVHRLISLVHRMKSAGLRRHGMDLLTAAVLVQQNHSNGEVVLTVDDALATELAAVFDDPEPWDPVMIGDLTHVALFGGLIVVELDPGDTPPWEHGFPVLIPKMPPAISAGEDVDDAQATAVDKARLKKLVLDNIMSTSVTLEYLRDPKVFAIPGLVEEVVNRTRNPQIIEAVSQVRALHTGFANKGVPLACLRSPVNVPVKSLRRFIHVRFVAKVDLKRLANDRTGVRKEIGREVDRYLKSLA